MRRIIIVTRSVLPKVCRFTSFWRFFVTSAATTVRHAARVACSAILAKTTLWQSRDWHEEPDKRWKQLPREEFQQLNRDKLAEEENDQLLEEIVTPDFFTGARTLLTRNSFIRGHGTPLNYTLVNLDDCCKNGFEVVNQLRRRPAYQRRASGPNRTEDARHQPSSRGLGATRAINIAPKTRRRN
jgi:hypothetical protein